MILPLWLLQTDALKDRVNNALWRDSPSPGYVHFPDWLGSWFYDELTYEERSSDGKWSKPGRECQRSFDLMVYAGLWSFCMDTKDPLAGCTGVGEPGNGWSVSRTVPNRHPHRNLYPRLLKTKRKKTVTDDVNPRLTSGGWL